MQPLDPKFTKPNGKNGATNGRQAGNLSDVHTMPKKFLEMQGVQKKSKNKIITIALIVVLVGGVMSASVFVFRGLFQEANPLENVNTPRATIVNDVNTLLANVISTNTDNKNAALSTNTNAVSNENTNAIENTNINGANTNANENSNGNENTNLEENTNENNNAATVTNSSKDTDEDKLTDLEEAIYGTRVNRPDSDADTYQDGEEILNLYDPLGNGRLANSPQISEFTNQIWGYTLLSPQSWLRDSTDEAQKTILFTADTGEFVEVFVLDNTSGKTAKAWYKEQLNATDPEPKEVQTKEGLVGVISTDTKTVYFANEKFIYGITYNTGLREEESFRTTFTMMYTSFVLVEPTKDIPESNSNAAKNTNATNGNKNANQNTNKNTNAKNTNTASNKNTQ